MALGMHLYRSKHRLSIAVTPAISPSYFRCPRSHLFSYIE